MTEEFSVNNVVPPNREQYSLQRTIPTVFSGWSDLTMVIPALGNASGPISERIQTLDPAQQLALLPTIRGALNQSGMDMNPRHCTTT
ncbi:MAG: hypothetical protein WCO06_07260 [Candidatus Roizmanbacteria bacterium]